jgi:hypothetical protein
METFFTAHICPFVFSALFQVHLSFCEEIMLFGVAKSKSMFSHRVLDYRPLIIPFNKARMNA